MPLLLAALIALLLAAPARAAWTPAEPVSRPAEDAGAPAVGPAGHVVYRDGRRVVLVSPEGRRTLLGRSRRPYEQAAVDGRGRVLVLYRVRIRRPDGLGTTTAVEAQTLSRRRGVSRPRRLGNFAFQATLAVNRRGRAVAAWVRDLPANRFAVVGAQGSTRRGLRPTGRISRGPGVALRPQVAIARGGRAMVAFAQDGRLRVSTRRAGRFRTPRDVGPASLRGFPNVALSIGPGGDAVAAWGYRVFGGQVFSEPGDTGSSVFAAVRRDGRWQRAQELPGPMLLRTEEPDAVMAPDGTALVGWVTAPGYEQPARPRVAASAPGTHFFGAPDDLAPADDVREIEVGATRDGTLHAAWARDLSVQVATWPPVGAWSPGSAVHEAPAHDLAMRGGGLAFDSPAGVAVSRYAG